MKKILIVASDMEIGGAERALLGLLNAIDTSNYEVDLFLLRHQGPFMKFIPEKIHLLPENSKYSDLGVSIKNVLKKGHFDIILARTFGKYKARRYIKKNQLGKMNSVEIHYSFLYTKKFLPMISDVEYDLAIGFTIPYYLVDEKVLAKKKVAWIHTDYSRIDGNTEEELKMWSVYDKIISISEAVTKSFIQKYSELEERVLQIDNIVSTQLIEQQAEQENIQNEMFCEENSTNLLSIGRFCEAKNFDNIPDICARILSKGCNIKWYIIGFGADEMLLREKIREKHMEKYVILLGKKDNPYPYIKKCNLYVQPSRFEGKAVTVREAQILGKPVVITNFPTAYSQLEDGVDGLIVPMDNEGCATEIVELLNNPVNMRKMSKNCSNRDYSNTVEVEKIYRMVEE